MHSKKEKRFLPTYGELEYLLLIKGCEPNHREIKEDEEEIMFMRGSFRGRRTYRGKSIRGG